MTVFVSSHLAKSGPPRARSRLLRRFAALRSAWLRAFGIGVQALVLWCSLTSPAAAQVITPIQPAVVTRERPLHSLPAKNYWINREDCTADDSFTFDLRVAAWNSNNFEVWAGDKDCKLLTERTGSLAGCWLVYKDRGESDSFSVTIKARDIVARQRPGDLDDPDAERSVGTLEDCDNGLSINATLYFMYVDDSGNVSGTPATWAKTGIDIDGPTAPKNVSAGIANESLAMHWDVSTSSDLVGYQFYCLEDNSADAVPATTASAAAATPSAEPALDAADASTDAALTDAAAPSAAAPPVDLSGTCGEGLLVAGEFPSQSKRVFACGTVTGTLATKGYATGLKNDVRYAVGVAGIDDLGNPGKLANVVCEAPQYVTQFYSEYRNKGGGGGGGFCSLRTGGYPTRGTGAWICAAGLFWILGLRRRL